LVTPATLTAWPAHMAPPVLIITTFDTKQGQLLLCFDMYGSSLETGGGDEHTATDLVDILF